MNCFRYFGFKSFAEVDQMTIREYRLLMKAALLKEADMDYHLHLQAYLNVVAQGKKKAGKNKEKFVYPTFDKFYNRQKVIDQILHPEKEQEKKDRLIEIGKILQRGGD